MKATTLNKIRESIDNGYLLEDWHDNKDQLIETETGFYSLKDNCIKIDGNYYHDENDSDEFCYDEIDEEYILQSDAVMAYGKRGREVFTKEDNCIYHNRTYYVKEYLSDNELVELDNGDITSYDNACCIDGSWYYTENCYYWESDGEYHLEEEEEENSLWGYGDGPSEKNFVKIDAKENESISFGWGVEIEKNELPDFDFNKQDIYDESGAVLERDSSVSNGFELKTPIYNLFSCKTEDRLKKLKPFADIKNVEGAGGHIGFSMTGKNDDQLIDLCTGFLPLIYSMYKKRLSNTYCSGKKIDDLKNSGDKFQAIRMRGNYIEFRIFSSVKSYDTLIFRLRLFRIIARNLGKSFSTVLGMAVNKNSELYKLLTSDVYSNPDKFERLIKDAIDINSQFGKRKLTQKTIDRISKKLHTLKAA
jgi:hypothetical protein